MATKLKAKYRIWYILIGLAAATLIKFLWSPGLFYVLAVGWVIAKAVAAIRKDKEIGYIATKVFWMAVLILILIPAGLNYSGQMAKDNPGHPVYSRLPGNPFESLAPAPKFTDSEPAKQVRNCVKVSQTDTIGDLTPGFKAEWRIPEHIVEYSDRDKNPFYSMKSGHWCSHTMINGLCRDQGRWKTCTGGKKCGFSPMPNASGDFEFQASSKGVKDLKFHYHINRCTMGPNEEWDDWDKARQAHEAKHGSQ